MVWTPRLFNWMTALDRVAKASCNTVNRFAGEWVTLLTSVNPITVRANIDRVNKPFAKVDSEISVQGEVGVTVYIMKRHLNAAPRMGMIVEESDETQHTIGEVKDL